MDSHCKFGQHRLTYYLLIGTSTYPSVYVAFHTIIATDLCGPVGSGIENVTTMAFNASELSTAVSYTASKSGPIAGQDVAWYITRASWWSYSSMDLQTRYDFHAMVP